MAMAETTIDASDASRARTPDFPFPPSLSNSIQTIIYRLKHVYGTWITRDGKYHQMGLHDKRRVRNNRPPSVPFSLFLIFEPRYPPSFYRDDLCSYCLSTYLYSFFSPSPTPGITEIEDSEVRVLGVNHWFPPSVLRPESQQSYYMTTSSPPIHAISAPLCRTVDVAHETQRTVISAKTSTSSFM